MNKTQIEHMTDREIYAAWRDGADSGRGYAVGETKMTPMEAAEYDEMTDIRTYDTPTSLATCVVARDGDDIIAIGDIYGPWAVKIGSMAAKRDAFLLSHPCPECGTVRLVDGKPGWATCDCTDQPWNIGAVRA